MLELNNIRPSTSSSHVLSAGNRPFVRKVTRLELIVCAKESTIGGKSFIDTKDTVVQ